jgi:hypothetical protein
MFRVLPSLLLYVLICASDVCAASPEKEIPVVGRPIDLPFSEASGWFEVKARAEPTELQVESPFTFTLVIHALKPVRLPPQRVDLRQLPEFAAAFYIEDSSEEAVRPDADTWEFSYRLKPRRPGSQIVPSLPFVYYNPYLLTTNKGFQVLYTDPIALNVLPAESVKVPVYGPEIAFELATGPGELDRRKAWTMPSRLTLVVVLLTPPAGCVVWYFVWRRMYPDAARLASLRRSRAARRALNALQAVRRPQAGQHATQTANIVTDYLQQRFDLTVAEATPREVAELFEKRGCSPELVARAVQFFERCDNARFVPADGPHVLPVELNEAAVQLILAVESAAEMKAK